MSFGKVMARAILLLAALLPVSARAQLTKSALTAQIGNCFPDNTVHAITPATTRTCIDSIINSFQQYTGVNPQVGTTYTIAAGDYGQLVTFNNASPIAVALPQAAGSFTTFNVFVRNIGAGTVTITPTTSTINGASTLVLTTGQNAWIISNGTNYITWIDGSFTIGCGGIPALTGDITNPAGSCATTLSTTIANPHTWTGVQTVTLNSGTLQSAQTGTVLRLANANSTSTRLELDAYGAQAFFTTLCAGGTAAAPTTLTAATQCGGYNMFGYDGTAFAGPAATFRTFANQNWAVGAHGTYAEVATTPNGSTTLTVACRFENDQGITCPNSVTGGSKGSGTINVSGGFYVGGAPVSPTSGGPLGTLLQGQGATVAPAWTTATFPGTATGTGTILRADGTNWVATTATYPATTTINQILYSSSGNVIAGLATANSGVLITSSGGVPSISSTLPSGIAATNMTLTTPTLGVAAGTSLALGGAAIGGNALAVTGTSLFNNAVTMSAALTYGGVTLSNSVTGIGSMVLSASPTITGTLSSAAHTITSSSATALAVGPSGTTNPTLQIDDSTASAATGIKVKSAAAGGGIAVSVITSGTNDNLAIDAAGSGTITFGGTSTGAIVHTRATTLSAALTYGGVTLSNAVTGTGNMVLATAPSVSSLTVTTAFTATGLVANASLANAAAYTFKGNATGSSTAPTDFTPASLTHKSTPGTGDLIMLSDVSASNATKYATIAEIIGSVATGVTSIAGNTGAFTLSGGITNATNNIQLSDMTAATVKGRASGAGTGAPTDLTAAQVLALLPAPKVLTFTRVLSAANGNVAYTGCGFAPRMVLAAGGIHNTPQNYVSYFGMADSSGAVGSVSGFAAGATQGITSTLLSFFDATGSNSEQATVASWDSDGITLTWTNSATSPVGTATFFLACIR